MYSISWSKMSPPNLDPSCVENLQNWARDITQFSIEYGTVINKYPNSIYYLFFDNFPPTSLFANRNDRRIFCSWSDCIQRNPISVVPSNATDEYHVSVADPNGGLFAMASLHDIRIFHQKSGELRHIIQASGTEQNAMWAVLAMAFSEGTDMFAAVFVSIIQGEESVYCPRVSVWDTSTYTPFISTILDFSFFGDVNCLVNRIGFSQDGAGLHGCGWAFGFQNGTTVHKFSHFMPPTTLNPKVVLFSPDSRWHLILQANDQFLLFDQEENLISTFRKPPRCGWVEERDSSVKPTSTEVHAGLNRRSNVAPFLWWQLWREITGRYVFSPDSRWFARITEGQSIILRNLKLNTELTVTTNGGSENLLNNIVFDCKSERLAWNSDYVGACEPLHATVGLLRLQQPSQILEFQVGPRCRERINFSADPNCVLLYRRGISMWDVESGLPLQESSVS